jgi:nucleoside-diphosphate-sugar epimerase
MTKLPNMQAARNYLLTGATGFVGRVFAQDLLAKSEDDEVWAVVRPSNGIPAKERPEIRELVADPRFHVLEGDVTLPGLGLDGQKRPSDFDATFHFAAETEFKEIYRERTFRSNLDGTKNLVAFLKALPDAGRLYHCSTTYVSWQCRDVVREELLPPGGDYSNPYEESKHLSESVVAESGLDWVILRLSILAGDSKTGAAVSDKMLYGFLKAYWRLREVLLNKYTGDQLEQLGGAKFVVQCREDIAKNVLCMDDATRLLRAAVAANPPSGTVLHIANPNVTDMREIHRAIFHVLGLDCLRLDVDPPRKPRSEERMISRGLNVYKPYMTYREPPFDLTALRSLVGDPLVDSVLPITPERLRFLLRTHLRDHLETSSVEFPEPSIDRFASLRRWGRNPLAYSTLQEPIKALPIGPDRGYVPFALKGRTAVMIGDPITPREDFREAVDAFFAHCAAHNLRPSAAQITRSVADAFAAHGGCCNRLGAEGNVDLTKWDPEIRGGRFEKLRHIQHRAISAGISIRDATYAEIPFAPVARVSQSWLDQKINKRELSALLRPLPAADEPEVRKFFAFLDNALCGFVFFSPQFEAESLMGFYSDLERYARKPDSIHDLILLEAARTFKTEGLSVLSLGLAPLFHLDREDHPSASAFTRDLLIRIRDEVGPVYNFQGVSHHKTLYDPGWEPVYFYSPKQNGASELLDVFTMVGLCPPEVLRVVGDHTFDIVHGE